MRSETDGDRLGGFRVRTVRGDAVHVSGRKLIPVARILSYGRARGTLGTARLGGWAGAITQIKPVAVIFEEDGEEQRIAITDATRRALWGIWGSGIALTLVLFIIRCLARRTARPRS